MLDLVFLVLMIIVLLRSLKGDFNLLMCNIAVVVGVVAAIVGIITAFFSDGANSNILGFLNIFVLIIAFLLNPVARKFAKLYQDKVDEATRSYFEEEENVKENFFRKTASENAYLHAAERGTAPSNAQTGRSQQGYNGGMANNAAFPQNGNTAANPMAANNAVFPQNGNSAANPMAANSAVFPQNGNPAASPMAMSDANSPKMEGISLPPKTTAAPPSEPDADNNYGLPYDLSAPIDLDRGIDDISDDNRK